MAQHDYDIANQSGSAFRADLNNALAAIVSDNSGSSAPTPTFAYQTWIDSSTNPATIKRRDASNANWVTVGTVDGAGSATAPGFAVGSGTTYKPGIYSPGTDQLALATGGAGRLFINSSGQVGIGTSSPGYKLDVNAESNLNGIRIGLNGDTINSTIAGASSVLGFQINGSEKVRIDSSGRLGIGNSSPSYQLDLDGGTTVNTRIRIARGSDDTNAMRIGYNTIDLYRNVPLASAQTGLTISQVGSDGTRNVFAIDSSGRCGIGTTSPSNTLHVQGPSGGTSARFTDAVNATILVSHPTAGTSQIADSGGNYGFQFASASVNILSGGSERARIDSSGRLLVGTSSGSAKLAVENAVDEHTLRLYVNSNSYSSNSLEIVRSGASGGNVASGSGLGRIGFSGLFGGTAYQAATIGCEVDATPGANDMPGRLVFSTTADGASSPTERMRISNVGKTTITAAAGVGTEVLSIENTVNSSGAYAGVTRLGSNCNNTSSYHLIAVTGGLDKYYIYGNGTTGTPSDNRLKKNIETARDGYLEDLAQLRVVKYNWNEQGDDAPKELGVIAQEVEEVFPGLIQEGPVKEDGTAYKGVKTSVLPFMLLKALQEATARIETLEAEVAALKGA